MSKTRKPLRISFEIPAETENAAAHKQLDEAGVPRWDSQGRQRSLSERLAFLLGRHESEKQAAWSDGLIGGMGQ